MAHWRYSSVPFYVSLYFLHVFAILFCNVRKGKISSCSNAGVPLDIGESGPMFRVGCKLLACRGGGGGVGEISNMFDISTTIADPCIRP